MMSTTSSKNLHDTLRSTRLVKVSEGRRLRPNSAGWGVLADYTLESVKICRQQDGAAFSTAVLRVFDRAGHISCIVRGPQIGLLFGLSQEEWKSIEKLSRKTRELFYRQFTKGLNDEFPVEQKMFYYFCKSCQKKDVLFVEFIRGISTRKVDKNKALLMITTIYKSSVKLLRLYNEANNNTTIKTS